MAVHGDESAQRTCYARMPYRKRGERRNDKRSNGEMIALEVNLAERELQIIRLIAEDRGQKYMMRELGISRTRYIQLRQALGDKLGVRGNISLVRMAIRNGIIEA